MRYIYLIPLFPLVGFLFNLIVGVRVLTPRGERPSEDGTGHGHEPTRAWPIVSWVACLSVALSLVVSVVAVVSARMAEASTLVETLWTWLPGGTVKWVAGTAPLLVDWAYRVDPLSSVWLLFVTLVGLLIHIYSTGYMKHDPGYARYMAYLNLFMFFMLTLVLGANYLVMFVGWEGVGLCSYLLIGFWFDKKSAADAGKKAFIVNRIGDAGFIIGMLFVFFAFGSLDFTRVAEGVARWPVDGAWTGTLTLIGLCLFIGACGKSAQLPLYVWLPDAMEGPTPVSALIHAATMVTAGVYMVARSAVLYAHAPKAMLVVAIVGAATALFAATIGLLQYDIKRVLAYSTISQLGYMFLACGVGAFGAGVFHVFTHAFFKALLFLGAGSVIHAIGGEQDMRKMGGLKDKLPKTRMVMLIGCLAIAGIPPLAGFFSKDEILWSAYKVGGYGQVVWFVALVTAALTAFYMFRLYHMTFGGSFRGTEEQASHVHESPRSMMVPLQILAAGSVLVGFLGLPQVFGLGNAFERFMEPALETAKGVIDGSVFTHVAHGAGLELGLMGISVLVAAAGIALAWQLYSRRPETADILAARFAGAHRVVLNKYYVDEAYDAAFVRGAALGGGRALWAFDRHGVDGGNGSVRPSWPLSVNGLAWLTRDIVAWASNLWDRWIVDGAVNTLARVFDNLSYVFRSFQNGLVQHYALVMVTAVLLMVGATYFFGLY